MDKLQVELQRVSAEYQKLQQDLGEVVQSRQRLESQRQENEGVKEEFDKLKEGEVIYKLVGPVLLKQERFEAEGTVKGRLDFIGKEIDRVEDQIKDIEKVIEGKKGEIIQIQAAAQALAQQQAQQSQQGKQVEA
ncbi:related to Gim complex component GIM1 [Cephalotrichum gorgonifer]|uniref:Related to Gim complex component GIM1 n=1 Tax=Cephalotrichum gorgonifer TaxID=2041049 RepID=A0AAE8MU55_9PEZI|nr:related to Gim complex component GIM1 [Cephalotrichum gorgonifer]